jgi:hypothetical protein
MSQLAYSVVFTVARAEADDEQSPDDFADEVPDVVHQQEVEDE